MGWEWLPHVRDEQSFESQAISQATGIQETGDRVRVVGSIQQDLCVPGASGVALEA